MSYRNHWRFGPKINANNLGAGLANRSTKHLAPFCNMDRVNSKMRSGSQLSMSYQPHPKYQQHEEKTPRLLSQGWCPSPHNGRYTLNCSKRYPRTKMEAILVWWVCFTALQFGRLTTQIANFWLFRTRFVLLLKSKMFCFTMQRLQREHHLRNNSTRLPD